MSTPSSPSDPEPFMQTFMSTQCRIIFLQYPCLGTLQKGALFLVSKSSPPGGWAVTHMSSSSPWACRMAANSQPTSADQHQIYRASWMPGRKSPGCHLEDHILNLLKKMLRTPCSFLEIAPRLVWAEFPSGSELCSNKMLWK